jgi:hypothetical protein
MISMWRCPACCWCTRACTWREQERTGTRCGLLALHFYKHCTTPTAMQRTIGSSAYKYRQLIKRVRGVQMLVLNMLSSHQSCESMQWRREDQLCSSLGGPTRDSPTVARKPPFGLGNFDKIVSFFYFSNSSTKPCLYIKNSHVYTSVDLDLTKTQPRNVIQVSSIQ